MLPTSGSLVVRTASVESQAAFEEANTASFVNSNLYQGCVPSHFEIGGVDSERESIECWRNG